MKKIIFFTILAFLLITSFLVSEKLPFGASSVSAGESTTIYFFWGDGCPHCAAQKPFLEEMENKYPELEVKMFETWKDEDNFELFQEVAETYGIQARGVPTTFIGDFEPIVGYADRMDDDIEAKIVECIEEGCIDPGVKAGIIEEAETSEPEPAVKSGVDGEEKISQSDEYENEAEQVSKTTEGESELCLHFFYKDDCSQCQALLEEGFLGELEGEYDIDIKRHNINLEEENELYQLFKENYGLSSGAYPIVFLGDGYYLGGTAIRDNLKDQIIDCQKKDCICPAEKIDGVTPSMPKSSDFTPEDKQEIKLPLLGKVDLSKTPLVLSTGLIAFVDGFNPCSLWLVSFLIGIVVHTGSRKKTFLVGTTFLLVTTSAYGLFMAGLLNVFSYIRYLTWIQIAVALIALVFALVNIKDYFWYKKGISFTIPDKYKPKIFKNMRGIMKDDRSTLSMMAATAGLALGVALVEMPCTAGFPVVWTNLLAHYQVTTRTFVSLLFLYLLIYLLDEMIVVVGASMTLQAGNFQEKHGRMLKLIGGMIMLSLALVMLINPDLMNSIGTSLLIFAGSTVAALLVMFVHRKVLPKYGIRIGTEEKILAPEGDASTSKKDKQNDNKINDKKI